MRAHPEISKRGLGTVSEPIAVSLSCLAVLLAATVMLALLGWAAGNAARSVIDFDIAPFL